MGKRADSAPGAGLRRFWAGAALLFLLALLAAVILRSAWLCDDAYITLRTADNWTHGLGLRWNPAERVQTYTHPLWLALLAGAYAITAEEYFTTIAVSVLAALAAAALLAFRIAGARTLGALALACLASSKAFVDYSTSGLENGLTHLLVAAFAALYLRGRSGSRALALLSGAFALVALNRLDACLLVLPALVHAVLERRSIRASLAVVAGLSPLLLWLGFGFFYYGSCLPNTYYAKLEAGIPRGELFEQGIHYLLVSVSMDPLTLTTFAAAAIWVLVAGDRRSFLLFFGALLYLGYIVIIGGDFMGGRFLSAPFFLAVLAASRQRLPGGAVAAAIACAAVLGLGLMPLRSPLRAGSDYAIEAKTDEKGWHGVSDERRFYFECAGLSFARKDGDFPSCTHAIEGRRDRDADLPVVLRAAVGFYPFFAGPRHHVVDRFALTDPLLARLPMERYRWRIGHFRREIPEGYMETLASGRNQIRDPGLAAYYDAIALVTRGDLFDLDRLRTALLLNLGRYDHLLGPR